MITVLYLWKIPKRAILFALAQMALDPIRTRRFAGVTFAKSLGCGKGERFTATDFDIQRWGLLVCIDEDQLDALDTSSITRRWRRRSLSEFRILLDPVSSHGKWSRVTPFDFRRASATESTEIAVITRARLSLRTIFEFWRAIPPVAQSLHNSEGVLAAIGIGEAPIGLQGTFSIWRSSKDIQNFAFKQGAHSDVIVATRNRVWYSEELFARFSVYEKRGSL